jgi:hypothetical protein
MSSADPDWSREFDDPIPLPDSRTLLTLHDAGRYATALPKAVQERVEWQTAAEMLILSAQGHRPVHAAGAARRQNFSTEAHARSADWGKADVTQMGHDFRV